MANIIFIDNFDSFTYNLVDEFRNLGHDVVIYRNDVPTKTIVQAIDQQKDSILALSPGPGTPSQAGNLLAIIDAVKETTPILGICLGHQALIESFGGQVVHAGEVMHGKVSMIDHDGEAMFTGLKNPLSVARYHSLCGKDLPKELIVTANYQQLNQESIVMAIRHESKPICGFQFHPESILSLQGSPLLKNTVNWLVEFQTA